MKKRQNNSARVAALQITFTVALLFASAIWLASAAPTNRKEAFGQSRLGVHSQEIVATPTLGNYPDASLPLSTDTTVTPDAAPTNTTSINVSTSTDFDGTLEGDPTTGVVRVTDAHPAGSYTVTVTAFDSGGATATKTFDLTVTTPETCNPVSFAAAVDLGVGTSPYSVAVGDFNGDGNQDLAVPNTFSANVSILLGDGAGQFSAPTNFTVGGAPRSVAVGDFNGDGNQDLAVANQDSDNVSILLGDGAGNFSAPTNFTVGNAPISVAVGDFNGDGKQDVAVANSGSHPPVSILLGDGTGNFSAPTNFSAGDYPSSVAVGDFNGDGNQDLAVANYNYSISILLGDGTGNFSRPTNFTVDFGPLSVAVGDFNGDGNQDLTVAYYFSNNVGILLGDGAGHFSAPTNFSAGEAPESVAVGDFNGDGNQDLAVADNLSGGVSILLGDGTGNFSAPTYFLVGPYPTSVAVGDFNGDGNQDLSVASYWSYVAILLRDCPGATLKLTSAASVKGSFAIDLPLTGPSGVEDRSGGPNGKYTVVMTFDQNITSVGSASATCGSVGSIAIDSSDAHKVNINLTGVAHGCNASTITITANSIGDDQGNTLESASVGLGLLLGDVNADRVVDSSDSQEGQSHKGQKADSTNFRSDVNASGHIEHSDIQLIRQVQGTSLP